MREKVFVFFVYYALPLLLRVACERVERYTIIFPLDGIVNSIFIPFYRIRNISTKYISVMIRLLDSVAGVHIFECVSCLFRSCSFDEILIYMHFGLCHGGKDEGKKQKPNWFLITFKKKSLKKDK